MVKIWLVAFVFATSTSGQQFHEPSAGVPQAVPGTIPGTAPKAQGPSPKRHHHQDIHLDLEKEREHIKAQVKNDYIDTEKLDDNSLLMQYFRSALGICQLFLNLSFELVCLISSDLSNIRQCLNNVSSVFICSEILFSAFYMCFYTS